MARFEKKVYKEIDRYLRGDITPEERMDYEIKLSLDPELQKEVRFQDFLVKSLAYGRRRQLHKYLFENASTKLWGNSWGRTGTIISLIIVLLAAIAFFVLKNQRMDQADLPDRDDSRITREQTAPKTAPALPLDTTEAGDTLSADTLRPPPDLSVFENRSGEDGYEAKPNLETRKIEEPEELLEEETTEETDSIKGDVMLRDVTLPVKKLEDDIADSLQIADAQTDLGGKYNVQVWESPVNFKGYKIEQKRITVYGLEQPESLQLRKLGENFYLLSGGKIYRLQQSQSFRPLMPIAPAQGTKQIKKK